MQVRIRTSHTPHAPQPPGQWLQCCLEQREHFSLCRCASGSCCARPSQTHSFLKTFLQLQSAVLTSSLEFLSLFVLTLFKAFSNSSLYLRQIRSQLIPSQNCELVGDRVSVLGEVSLLWACWSHPTRQVSPGAWQTPRFQSHSETYSQTTPL